MVWIQNIGCMRRVNGGDMFVDSTVVLFPNGMVTVCSSGSLSGVLGGANYSVLPGLVLPVSAYKRMINVYKEKRNATVEGVVLQSIK